MLAEVELAVLLFSAEPEPHATLATRAELTTTPHARFTLHLWREGRKGDLWPPAAARIIYGEYGKCHDDGESEHRREELARLPGGAMLRRDDVISAHCENQAVLHEDWQLHCSYR